MTKGRQIIGILLLSLIAVGCRKEVRPAEEFSCASATEEASEAETETSVGTEDSAESAAIPPEDSGEEASEEEAGSDSSGEREEASKSGEESPAAIASEPESENPAEPEWDTVRIAALVAEAINGMRPEPARVLPGLTKVAEYRSRQLLSDFSHNVEDMREAYTVYRYGEHCRREETVWNEEEQTVTPTGRILDYYEVPGAEAIGCLSGVGEASPNWLAEELAGACRQSEAHWAYIGSTEYPYMAVGVSFDGWDRWYCCILVCSTDQYE